MSSFGGELSMGELGELFWGRLKALGCSETGAETTGAATVKVPNVKKSRRWRNNMSDALDRRCEC